jgi:hypothetical protein
LRDQFERTQLLAVGKIANLHERLGANHRPDADGFPRIEHLTRLERQQVAIDLDLSGHVDAFNSVRQDEAVHADHDRDRQRLGQPERLDVQVERFLVRFRVQLDPPRIPHGHAVRVVIPYIDGGADCAVTDRHHDRQAQAGGVVDRLGHEEQPLAAGRGIGPGTGRRGADRNRQRRELGLDVDEVATAEFARFHHLAESLDDVSLRRDRIGADHLRARQCNGLGHRA